MSHYTKERNLITFHLDGVNGTYVLNIENGEFLGLKGQPLKTCQKKNAIRQLFVGDDTHHLDRLLYWVFDFGQTSQYVHFTRAMGAAERLDNMEFVGRIWSIDDYDYIGQMFNEFVRYRRTLDEGEEFNIRNFKDWILLEEARGNLGSIADHISPTMYRDVKYRLYNITQEEWGVIAYYLSRNKMWEYDGSACKVCEYIKLCRDMNKKPQKQNNFPREYIETKKTYELNKQEYENNRLRGNYAKQEKAFTFTYGEYSVFCPTCAKDIIDEGANMHHCVGSYVNQVVNNSTYIVFIRKTNEPNQCYITCQVGTNGELGQYFLAYDRYISSTEDIEFRNAFQKHLRENWNR